MPFPRTILWAEHYDRDCLGLIVMMCIVRHLACYVDEIIDAKNNHVEHFSIPEWSGA